MIALQSRYIWTKLYSLYYIVCILNGFKVYLPILALVKSALSVSREGSAEQSGISEIETSSWPLNNLLSEHTEFAEL